MKLYTLPNFITLGNLLCGVFGILMVSRGEVQMAAMLIAVALILDFLDGFVARLFKMHSEVGKQLDSLADMVSFGALPSFILFALLKEDAGVWAYLSFLPVLFSALRLAKFNLDERQSDTFYGLPTPANAITVASFPFILAEPDVLSGQFNSSLFLLVYACLISWFLVLDYPMLALKFKNFSWQTNYTRYIFLILSVILLAVLQFAAVPLILIVYLIISVATNLLKRRTKSERLG